jgi:hypothetical protein
MANPVRKRKKAARKQARKYKKMSDQERYERIMAAKAKRGVSAKKKSGSVNPSMGDVTVTAKKTTNQEKAKAASADIKKKKAVSKENERVVANRKAAAAAKPGQVYTRTMKDGTKKKVKAIKK